MKGLTTDEAAERLARFGANDPSKTKKRSLGFELLSLFANPLVLILLFAAR